MKKLGIAFVLLGASLLAACTSAEPFCGDGEIDPGELCDDGNDDNTDGCLSNCEPRPVPTLTVKWEFNKEAVQGFTGDNCTDLNVRQVEVTITSGATVFSKIESCAGRQAVFVDIPSANYSVSVRPLDRDDNMVTIQPVERAAAFSGGTQENIVVNITPEEWAGQHTGTFTYRLQWGGEDCAAATPPVAEHRLKLRVDDKIVNSTTESGDPLNGSRPGACIPLTEAFPQNALEVPFGYAEFEVEGLDASGSTAFKQKFDTFVGAGLSNPELLFDVSPSSPE